MYFNAKTFFTSTAGVWSSHRAYIQSLPLDSWQVGITYEPLCSDIIETIHLRAGLQVGSHLGPLGDRAKKMSWVAGGGIECPHKFGATCFPVPAGNPGSFRWASRWADPARTPCSSCSFTTPFMQLLPKIYVFVKETGPAILYCFSAVTYWRAATVIIDIFTTITAVVVDRLVTELPDPGRQRNLR